MKLVDKDKIVAEIERKKIPFKKDIDDGVYPTYLCALMDFEDFINTLEVKEDVVSNDPIANSLEISRHGNPHNGETLEEASRNYADNEEYGDDVYYAIKSAFKEGAKWQKEQMMKEAIETIVSSMVHQLIVTDYIIVNAEQFGLKKGNKVKVLIVKEE